MARVTGPLMSMGASGTIGGALTFSNWRGVATVRKYTVPSNPNTADQQAVRGVFSAATALYKGITPTDVEAWNRRAAGTPMSGYNLLVKQYSQVATAAGDMIKYSEVASTAIAANKSTVTFKANAVGPARISYGTNPTTPDSYVDIAATVNGENTKDITGLNPGTTYYFRIVSTDLAPKVGETGVYIIS